MNKHNIDFRVTKLLIQFDISSSSKHHNELYLFSQSEKNNVMGPVDILELETNMKSGFLLGIVQFAF